MVLAGTRKLAGRNFCTRIFPHATSRNGVSNGKVAQAKRIYFRGAYHSKLVERIEIFIQAHEGESIRRFQPIQRFSAHGKYHTSFNDEWGRKMITSTLRFAKVGGGVGIKLGSQEDKRKQTVKVS